MRFGLVSVPSDAILGIVLLEEQANPARLFSLALILAGIVGLSSQPMPNSSFQPTALSGRWTSTFVLQQYPGPSL